MCPSNLKLLSLYVVYYWSVKSEKIRKVGTDQAVWQHCPLAQGERGTVVISSRW